MKTNTINDIASYLTFKLGAGLYAIPVLKVLNIVEMSSVTSLHDNNLIIGMVNLRGVPVPVTDVRLKFGMGQVGYSDKSCLLIVEILNIFEKLIVGIIIDALQEVTEIKRNEITDSAYPVCGVFRKNKYVSINIIDQDVLFNEAEISILKKLIKSK
jgi:purine-binding chemotaxis protein CheW